LSNLRFRSLAGGTVTNAAGVSAPRTGITIAGVSKTLAVKGLLIVAVATTLVAQQTQPPRAVVPESAGDDQRGYTDTPQLPGQRWKVHDADRPRPPKVQPGMPLLSEAPPFDAIVLFDGKDLSHWVQKPRAGRAGAQSGVPQPAPAAVPLEPKWKVENGYLEIVPRTGRLETKEKFGDCQLHVEWMINEAEGAGQNRGNSGIELMTRYEIQVLESFTNQTYADGQAASIYGQWPPLLNASRPQGEWNVFDIFFEAPRFAGEQLVKPAYFTVIHNGVLVQNHKETLGTTVHRKVAQYAPHPAEEPLSLQDHGQLVRFRNIWVRRLKPYDVQ
jgi:3-keto-disaccharide hydrolase